MVIGRWSARMEATPRDLRKVRKHLSAPGLLTGVRERFERIEEAGRCCRHTLTDNLMCGLGSVRV